MVECSSDWSPFSASSHYGGGGGDDGDDDSGSAGGCDCCCGCCCGWGAFARHCCCPLHCRTLSCPPPQACPPPPLHRPLLPPSHLGGHCREAPSASPDDWARAWQWRCCRSPKEGTAERRKCRERSAWRASSWGTWCCTDGNWVEREVEKAKGKWVGFVVM